jgi:uracil-DNA glycosylase family 4
MKPDSARLDALQAEVIACRRCPRLVAWREEVGRIKRKAYRDWEYWSRPVPGFGDPDAQVLVVGLAPGAHGSNRTGRMFTGDDSGKFLFPALWRAGFTNQPTTLDVNDGLILKNLWITALCRCVPPDNKPNPDEIRACRPFLEEELALLTRIKGIVALGKLAYDEILRYPIFENRDDKPSFGHGVIILAERERPWLVGSYHPSRQNTQTGRLTAGMFDAIWEKVNALLVD